MLIWNVKYCATVSQAVSAMRHNFPDCAVSPECETRRLPWGKTIETRRKLQTRLKELQRLSCDEYYEKHGTKDYEEKCSEFFEIKQRRGYVKLIMKP